MAFFAGGAGGDADRSNGDPGGVDPRGADRGAADRGVAGWSGADRGETLLELLVSLVILGIALVAIAGGITAAVLVSDTHRKQATAAAYVHDYAEAVETAVAGGGYVATCTPAYASSFAVPSGYAASITAVSFWNGSSFPSPCSATGDQGVQQLTLRVSSADGRAAESLVLVVRRPCGPGSSCT